MAPNGKNGMTESGEQPQGRPVRVEDYIDKLRARLLAALPLDIDSRHWLAVLAEYLQRNPKLFSCTAISLEGAIVDAAMLGLELGPPFDMASIIPFKSRRLPSPVASLVIEYRGHMAQVYRTGRVRTIEARPVYHQDVFDYQFGREPVLLHRPANDPNRGKLIYAYAIAYFCDGGLAVEVINQHDAARARADSPDAGRP
jgi:recombination protein RecT